MIKLRDALFFVGGVAVGLYVAKLYARQQVNSGIANVLNTFGLSGLTPTVQGLVTPQIVN